MKIHFFIVIVIMMVSVMGYTEPAIRSYNDQTVDTREVKVHMPSTVRELQSIVRMAYLSGTKLRIAGAGHSTSSIIKGEDEYIRLNYLNKLGPIEVSESGTTITVEAGVKLGQLSDYLHSKGYSLGFAFPAYRDMTVGGLIATGSHGSSRLHTAVSSQTVVEMNLIKGDGADVVLNEKTPDTFKAAKTSLGLLGVVYKIKLKIEPEFNLEMRTQALEGRNSLLSEQGKVNWGQVADYESIAWFPYDDKAVKFSGSKTNKSSMAGAENITLGQDDKNSFTTYAAKYLLKWGRHFKVLNQLTEYLRFKGLVKNPPFVYTDEAGDVNSDTVIGSSNKILLSRGVDLNSLYTQEDTSFSFPESQAYEVLTTIRDFSLKNNYRFPMVGVYFRFGHSDGGSYLSHIERPGRAGELFVMAEFMEYKDYGVTQMPRVKRDELREELMKTLVEKHNVGFHWGKNSNKLLLSSHLEKVYGENIEKFNLQALLMDPKSVFDSNFTRALLRRTKSCKTISGIASASSNRSNP